MLDPDLSNYKKKYCSVDCLLMGYQDGIRLQYNINNREALGLTVKAAAVWDGTLTYTLHHGNTQWCILCPQYYRPIWQESNRMQQLSVYPVWQEPPLPVRAAIIQLPLPGAVRSNFSIFSIFSIFFSLRTDGQTDRQTVNCVRSQCKYLSLAINAYRSQ